MGLKPGYKRTEVGFIPEEWEVRSLESLSEKMTVGIASAATHAYRAKGVPLLRNQNIKAGYLDDTDLLFIDPEYEKAFRTKRLRAGDLLTARTGYPGITCVVPQQHEGSQSFTTLITRPKSREIESKYLSYFINSTAGQRFFDKSQIGGAQKNVNTGTLRKMPIPVAPLPEQHAIAEALSDVDGLLDGLDRLIAKKRDLKQAAMQQLLTPPSEGGTRLPGFRGEWEVKTLGDIVEKILGGGTPSRANPAFWGAEIPWITVKDFATFNPRHSQESITQLGLRNSASNLIPAGTLITSTRMALGKAVVYEIDVAINQDLKALFLKPETSVVFLTYWFEHFGRMIDDLGSGSTVKGISLGELRQFPFQAPPLPEQTAIAEVLTDMDAEIAALEQRLGKTRALKQGMMQELLTGKTRLILSKEGHA
jgi:type I restriction enzyme S subunit